MTEAPKGLVMDFDNTIVRTMDFVSDHIAETCQVLGLKSPDRESILAILKQNPPFEKIFETLFSERAAEVLTQYRSNAMEKPFTPVEGGHDAIKRLWEKKVEIIIVSNRTNKLSERLDQAEYDPQSFLAIVQPIEPKPSKEAYTDAIKILMDKGILRKNIFITGDSLDDYQACPKDLSGNFFALLSGPNTKDEFVEAGVNEDNILSSIAVLPDRITINGRD